MIGHITLGTKHAGERNAGNPHVTFDVEGAGNVIQPDDGCIDAPVLDPTDRNTHFDRLGAARRQGQDAGIGSGA